MDAEAEISDLELSIKRTALLTCMATGRRFIECENAAIQFHILDTTMEYDKEQLTEYVRCFNDSYDEYRQKMRQHEQDRDRL